MEGPSLDEAAFQEVGLLPRLLPHRLGLSLGESLEGVVAGILLGGRIRIEHDGGLISHYAFTSLHFRLREHAVPHRFHFHPNHLDSQLDYRFESLPHTQVVSWQGPPSLQILLSRPAAEGIISPLPGGRELWLSIAAAFLERAVSRDHSFAT